MSSLSIWVAIARAFSRRDGAAKLAWRPVRPLVIFAVFTFVLSLWQGLYVDSLFAEYSYDYGVENVDIFGVFIPLELGENINRFVSSGFSFLFNLVVFVVISYALVFAIRSPELKAQITVSRWWVFGLFALYVLTFGWSLWQGFPRQIANFKEFSNEKESG